jgi:hypothetical protein
MRTHRVRDLLMGGQACVLYGAAEFSRDTDFAILAAATNLARLRTALTDLQADVITVPPLRLKYLQRGHAIHFRCQHPDARGMRVDVMSHMRGVDTFAKLWRRRTTIELPDGSICDVLALPDLVQAKKTQRDKDSRRGGHRARAGQALLVAVAARIGDAPAIPISPEAP